MTGQEARDGSVVILAIKLVVALVLAVGSVGWVLIIRASGDDHPYPYLLAAFLFGVGILIGTLWKDDRG